jgi:hypothetical protein
MLPSDPVRQTAVNRAVERYARTLRQGTNPCRADRDPSAQTDNYRRALEQQELRAEQVRSVLDSLGVPRIHHIAYRSYALQLDAIIRRYSGETLRALLMAASSRWTRYGLDPKVLRAIAERVYGLTAL